MSNVVCKSYFDAIDAEEDVETLIASGQRRSDITVIFSDRGRWRYRGESAARGLRRGSVIAEAIMGAPHPSGLQATISEAEEESAPVTIWGCLSQPLVGRVGIRARGELLEVMMLAGVRRSVAERVLADVFRGGILVAVRVRDGADSIVQRLLGYSVQRHVGFAHQRLSASLLNP